MYLVIGASGNVGGAVVDRLLDSGKQVRVFTRDSAKIARWGDRVQLVIGDFEKPESFAPAFAGIEAAFLMNGGDTAQFTRLVAAAKAQGSPRLVFLSTIFAAVPGIHIGKLHHDKEDAIRASGLPAAFVRPGGFMSNSYQWIGSIKAEGAVYNAMGTGQSAPIAPQDIAAVAVQALNSAELAGQVYEVTGGELLSVPQQVAILAEVLGRPLRCVDVPVEAAVQGLIRGGVPPAIAAIIGQSFEAVRDGGSAMLRDTVEKVTGRPAQTFKAWAQQHAAHFA